MRVTVLASGSKGNATLIESGGARILVDAGRAPRTLRREMLSVLGGVPDRLDAVVITHAHGDHAAYGEKLAASFSAPLYMTAPTKEIVSPRCGDVRVFGTEEPIELGPLSLRALALPHDRPQVGLIVSDGVDRLGVATDLGRPPPSLARELSGCRTVLLESNHDRELLAKGPYPSHLKARVASELGHLSNLQAAALLTELGPELETVVLMHLSEVNNRPGLALASARGALDGRKVKVLAAHQCSPVVVNTGPPAQLELSFTAANLSH